MAPSMISQAFINLQLDATKQLVPSLIASRDIAFKYNSTNMYDSEYRRSVIGNYYLSELCKSRALFVAGFILPGVTIAFPSLSVAMVLASIIRKLVPKSVRNPKRVKEVYPFNQLQRLINEPTHPNAEWQELPAHLERPVQTDLEGQLAPHGSPHSEIQNFQEPTRPVPPPYRSQESILTIYVNAPQAPPASHFLQERAQSSPPADISVPAAVSVLHQQVPRVAHLMDFNPKTQAIVGGIMLAMMIILLSFGALGIQAAIYCPNWVYAVQWQFLLWLAFSLVCAYCALGLSCWLILIVNLLPQHYQQALTVRETSVITTSIRIMCVPFEFAWAFLYGFYLIATDAGGWLWIFLKYIWEKSLLSFARAG